MVENTDKKILILSMEGGGVRGILQAEFLRLLEGASKQMVPEIFDFFNGVSIGGIHALFFVMDRQYYAGKLLNLYTDKTLKRIFPKDPFGWLNPGGIWYPKYKSSQKTAVLAEILKKYKIRDAQKPVMVFSYDYINAKACYFSTYSKTESTLDLFAVDAADATSAAVAYFLPKFIKSENAYFLDGCVISNNPCMGAFIEVLKNGYSPNNIKILSLGTGTKQTISLRSGKASMKWGGLQWFIKGGLIIKLVNASTDSSVHQCEKILGKNFMYIPFADAPVSGIDDISPKMIEELKDAAKREFENVSKDVLNFIST